MQQSVFTAVALALSLTFGSMGVARAERADRLQKINIAADQSGQIDLQKQTVVYSGNVVITRGTMQIRAAKVEVKQLPTGYYTAVAFAAPGSAATFRQKRDGVDEYVEGEAERIEYDGRTDFVKFINKAEVRRLRGTNPADEISGNLITYDATTEKMTVLGGAEPTPGNPTGRVRAVLTPGAGTEAAAEAAEAASGAGPLKMTPTLPPPKAGDKR